MKRAWCILLWLGTAHADDVLTTRTEPAREQQKLDKGTADEKRRVLARAAASRDDEALATLASAAERARALELQQPELVLVARGLALRGRTKPARDALFALLVTPPREGFDGRALHQRIAATALAAVADVPDPPSGGPPGEPAQPAPGTLDKLLGLAGDTRYEATITEAFVRHPPRLVPLAFEAPATLRIGARLGDLRWAPGVLAALAHATDDELRVSALAAAEALGITRALPQAQALRDHPNPLVAAAAFRAWLSFDPGSALPQLERRLQEPGAPTALLALARFVHRPEVLAAVVKRLARVDSTPEAIRVLATLPGDAGLQALRAFAEHEGSVQVAADALGSMPGSGATQVLGALLDDVRPVVRHEASFALVQRFLDGGSESAAARRCLEARRARLSVVVRSVLDGEPTARQRAANELYATWRHADVSSGELASCARALDVRAPACAYAYGRAMRADYTSRHDDLASLLRTPDPSVLGELLQGLADGGFAGHEAADTRGLQRTTDVALRRRLAARVPSAFVAASEPDPLAARLEAGLPATLLPRPRLLRAEPDGRIRCGYSRDELGEVVPFVLEEGGALLPAVHGEQLELTFIRCDASVVR